MKIVLNMFDDPFMGGREYTTVGNFVYGRIRGEEFYITKNKKYKILDSNGYDLIKVKNDKDIEDWYSVEYFSNYESM